MSDVALVSRLPDLKVPCPECHGPLLGEREWDPVNDAWVLRRAICRNGPHSFRTIDLTDCSVQPCPHCPGVPGYVIVHEPRMPIDFDPRVAVPLSTGYVLGCCAHELRPEGNQPAITVFQMTDGKPRVTWGRQ